MQNPYATALKGLDIEDPVKEFFDWCIERETIRIKRENGEVPPWSDDPVFQKGRFLNVFREDDRGSKAVLRFCKPFEQSIPDLIHALFFSRWCNQRTTLDALPPHLLKDPKGLKDALLYKVPQPWWSEVYPVVPVLWEGRSYSRLEACTELFLQIVHFLVQSVKDAQKDVVKATNLINKEFQMANDFPIFMAIVDISWFRPELIDPESPVPSGIGAIPYLDRLQEFLGLPDHHTTAKKMIALQPKYWPEARRKLTPVDIEYLSCECRKYFSYVNGTKRFEGKNEFTPFDPT